jgi:dihydrofolate synthase/folylpolyglutamate synthase
MVKILDWPNGQKTNRIDMGLKKMFHVMQMLGNPHLNLPPTIHIAGTNGKASTLAFLKSILEEAGKTVHTYTSPNLIHINERIVLCGREISDEDLLQGLGKMREILEMHEKELADEMTFFEGLTAFAFWKFAQIPADFLLLEVGLGGSLDATNIISSPIMSLITSISFDHTEFLGETIADIASQKGGIIKPNGLTICGFQPYEGAYDVIKKIANEHHNTYYQFGIDFTAEKTLKLGLKGGFQVYNSALAKFAAKLLNILDMHIQNGLENAKLLGRMQDISKAKWVQAINPKMQVFLDGAHNEGGLEMLLDEIKPCTHLIIGTLAKRDLEIFRKLLAVRQNIASIYTVPIESFLGGKDPNEFANFLCKIGLEAEATDSPITALKAITQAGGNRVIIFGSLYLVGNVLEL